MNQTIPSSAEVQAVLSTLTPNQKQFLIECRNYKNVEQQRSDNFSNAGKKEAAGGLITSLNAKGLGSLDTEFDLGIEVACSL